MKKVRFEEDESRSIRKTSLQKMALERCESWIQSVTPNEVPKTRPFIRKILPDEIVSKMATGKRKILSWNRDNNKANKFGEIPLSLGRMIKEEGKKRTEKIVDFMESTSDYDKKTSNLIKSLADTKLKIRKPNKIQIVNQPIEKQSVLRARHFPVKWLGPRLTELTSKSRASLILEHQPSVRPVDEKRKEEQKTLGTRRKTKRTRIAPLPAKNVSKARLFPVKWLGPRLKELTTKSRASLVLERKPSVPAVDEKRKEKQMTLGTRRKMKRTRIAPLPEKKLEEKDISGNIDGYDSHLHPFSGNLAKKQSSFQKIIKKNVEILLKRIRQRVSILVTDTVDVAAFEPKIDLEEESPISGWSFSQTGAETIQPRSLFDVEGMAPVISGPFSKNESVAILGHNLEQMSSPFANSRVELSSEKWSENGMDDKRRLKRKTKPLCRLFGRSNRSSLPTIEEVEETAED